MRIGELAKLSNTPPRSLRYYEEQGPIHRRGTSLTVPAAARFGPSIPTAGASGGSAPVVRDQPWAPDGHHLAYEDYGGFYLVDADSPGNVRLIARDAAEPAWQP